MLRVMKYCDDEQCPHLDYGIDEDNCDFGFKNRFKTPSSMMDCYTGNWGYVMPKICRWKFKKAKAHALKSPA